LDINVTECGESFYNELIPPVIEELKGLNMVVNDNGAKCVFVGAPYRIPLMVQKSDGGFGYDSTDMAALSYRLRTLKADRIVYITDFTQTDHFMMCFEAAKQAGWHNETSHKLSHIGFGVVQGEDGKRFATRSGETVRLVDLLDESVTRMEKGLRERAEEGKGSIPEDEIRYVFCSVLFCSVFDAANIKSDLSHHHLTQSTQDAAVPENNPVSRHLLIHFYIHLQKPRRFV
jgi:arginyl-tRNA synthetase